MEPYYQDEGITIYCGDCREIMLELEAVDMINSDPVWPNALPELVGADRPYELFAEAAALFPRITHRAIIQLGCNSDPRFLAGMPRDLPFFRVCWLEYVRPHYQGHLMYTGDVAYCFGTFRAPTHLGCRVLPGRMVVTSKDGKYRGHPTPRNPTMVRWLLKWFSRPGDVILDPFAGSGTTGVVAKETGRKAILIEIEERYCELSAKRMQQTVMLLEGGHENATVSGREGVGYQLHLARGQNRSPGDGCGQN